MITRMLWNLLLGDTLAISLLEPQQRAHSPQLAAGLARPVKSSEEGRKAAFNGASEYKIRLKVFTVEDSLQLAAGFFNR